jgi:hypothetical protein
VPTFRDNLYGPIFKGEEAFFLEFLALEDGIDIVPKRRHRITTLRSVISQKRAGLIYIAAED